MMQRATSSIVNRLCSLASVRSFSATHPRLDDDDSNFPSSQRRNDRDRFFFNEITLIGRVGATPEERGPEGRTIAVFPMVTKRFHKRDGEEVVYKDWHRILVAAPNAKAVALSQIHVGSRVMIMGRLSYRIDNEGRNVAHVDAGRVFSLTQPNRDRQPRAQHEEDETTEDLEDLESREESSEIKSEN